MTPRGGVSGGRGSERARGKEKNRPGINRAELAEFIMIGRGKEMEIKNRGKYREAGPRGRMVLKKRRRGSGGRGWTRVPAVRSARESTAMGESGPPGNGVQKAKGEGETLHPTILAGRGGKGRGGEGRGRVVGRGVGTAKSD